ncbi:MAG: response regulator [Bacteroidota bacterium]
MDRDKDILDIITYIFVERGYSVLSLSNDDRIFDHIHIFSPIVLILDIVNINEEGTETCMAIKASPTTKHIPILVMSTHVKLADLKCKCADDVLPKPFDLDELVTIVEQLIL